jgi:anaerobic selenocysteine-containing dehydrogenase
MNLEHRRTFCRVCHAACPLDVLIERPDGDGTPKVVKVSGVNDDPMFEGYTCVKGRQVGRQHHHEDRLLTALMKNADGSFEPTASSDALDSIASTLRQIIAEHGPRSIATYTGTGGYQNSTSMPVTRAFMEAIDSPSFYTSVTIDQPAHVTSKLRMGSWEAGWHNFSDSDVHLAVGYNSLVSAYAPAGGLQGTNPLIRLRRAKDRGMKLVVVDPRRSELATYADVWLPIRPGEDPTLLAGMLRHILRENLYDSRFVSQHIDGIDELRSAVEPFDLDYVSTRCALDRRDIVRAAELFCAGPRGTAGTGTGPNMAPHSTLTEHLVLSLNALCGRVNREGDHLESGNFLGPSDVVRAQVIPPGNPTPGSPHRMRGMFGLPGEMLTPLLAEEILLEGPGKVRCLFVCGGNPVVAFPDQRQILEALSQLELLVVIDHRMTPTAQLADFVLPPRLQLERADVASVMDRRYPLPYVSYTPQVLPRRGDTLSEWEVFVELARRLDLELRLNGNTLDYSTPLSDDEILDAIYSNSRMGMNDIRQNQGTIRADRAVRVVAGDPENKARMAVGLEAITSELKAVRAESSSAIVIDGFDPEHHDFRLISRRSKHVLNSLGREISELARHGSTNEAHMNPADLVRLGLEEGDVVHITSPSASIQAFVTGDSAISPSSISISHAWGLFDTDESLPVHGSPTNRLCTMSSGTDPLNAMAIQSAIPVRITRS